LDFEAFLDELRASEDYAGQVVYVGRAPARCARFADPGAALPAPVREMLGRRGVGRLYCHQAEALDRLRGGESVVIAAGTAGGKTLCYTLPIIEALMADRQATALLLFPTKALCQDQFRGFAAALDAAGLAGVPAGVYDGDTPAATRRRLRDEGSAIFSNPDMLHAALMPQHGRWAQFLSRLRFLVLDELHAYSGIFGSNMANLMRRFRRVCRHYGSEPQIVACSATVRDPRRLAETVAGRPMVLVDDDGSPRGRRIYVLWNPPRLRGTPWRSRRSANVEAHELMATLIQRGVPTITFSKAKITAEMIYRYVCEKLGREAPQLVGKVTPYRGGYIPEERRRIERRLFDGELIGVSTTRALELGIDVGALDASILVGYPGTLASFFQQSGRAGRQERDCLVVLIGLDTAVNQYIMSHPDYLFGRPVEEAVLDLDNPFVLTGHLRCAAHELPLADAEATVFGPSARVVLAVLEENLKVRRIGDSWYHAADETPQHETSLRGYAGGNVVIEEADTRRTIGEVNRFDAEPILHPGAIYIHRGETYRVEALDLDRDIATVRPVQTDYYTQPLGGQDVHHVDRRLREKPFGSGTACWGEVTAHDRTWGYEKVHFYSLDAISRHGVDLPALVLETMAFWLVPPERLMERVRAAGLDAHSGLRGVGYATRMLLPLFETCQTLDFSHTVGSVNSPWQAVFVYERHAHGLGFTEKAYERLHELMPAVLEHVRGCPCGDGCPCCVGKPLRQYATWNVERGEASIPSKAAAVMILEGLLGDGSRLDEPDVAAEGDDALSAERALRRRLERSREPQLFHPIEPDVATGYPEIERADALGRPDVARRVERRREFHARLRRRLAGKGDGDRIDPLAGRPRPPGGMRTRGGSKPPTAFPGRPQGPREEDLGDQPRPDGQAEAARPITHGDSLAARARRMKKRKADGKG